MRCYHCAGSDERRNGQRRTLAKEVFDWSTASTVEEMKIPVLIETISGQRYRATGGEPFGGSAEGETPEAALQEMRRCIEDRVANGARIATLDLPDERIPWAGGPGMFRDSPLFDAWRQAMADYRRTVDDADGP